MRTMRRTGRCTIVWVLGLWLPLQAGATTNFEDEVEVLGGVSFTHHFVTAGDSHWHYAEGGDPNAEAVLFIAGLPESWYSFHPQMIELAPTHRVLSLDLFGQTVRPDTASFLTEDIAADIIAWADAVGLGRFNLVTHDWGTMIGHRVVGLYPQRVLRYARMEAPLHVADPDLVPQAVLFQSLVFTQVFFSDPNVFIPTIYGDRTVQPLAAEVMQRLIQESEHTEQLALTAHRLFKDNLPDPNAAAGYSAGSVELAAAMTMPVMLIQADQDPAQPLYYFDGSQGDPPAVDLFLNAPFAQLWVITESGHFTELEQPQQVNQALGKLLATDASSHALKCRASKAKATGKKAADLLKAFGKNVKKPDSLKLSAAISKAESKFTKAFTKAEDKRGCQTNGDSGSIEAKVDAFVEDLIDRVAP